MVDIRIKNIKNATDQELEAEYERLEKSYDSDEIYRSYELDEYYSSICNELAWRNLWDEDIGDDY